MLNKIRQTVKEHRPPASLFLLILIVLAVSAWLIIRNRSGQNDILKASGTIEAVTVNIAPEMAGRVKEVLVEQGQTVQAGQLLLRLDDSLLSAQRAAAATAVETANSAAQTAQAAYESAQAQYDIALNAARLAEGAARIADWIGKRPDYFEQPTWYFTRQEQIAAAQAEVAAAEARVNDAQTTLNQIVQKINSVDFLTAEKRLAEARIAYLIAKEVNARAQLSEQQVSPEEIPARCPPWVNCYRTKIGIAKEISGQDEDLIDAAQEAYDAAKVELEEAQKNYDALLTTQAARDVLAARAQLVLAKERLEVARDHLSMLQTGEESPQVVAAARGVEQAKAAMLQAQNAVRQAEANLALVDTQMTKLEIFAPADGVVLNRYVEAGEFVQPGSIVIELTRLENLTITVYVPEDRYGQIRLGQMASVTVDSFPGETFEASVIYISDQAEFTPRNVQTVEGRSTTVYAVKLRLNDPAGKLKPGMPADVIFHP